MQRSTTETIECYSPRSVPEPAAAFAREVVAKAAPPSASRAKALLFAASKLAAYGLKVGKEPGEGLLSPEFVERFTALGTTSLTRASARTMRSNLTYLASVVAPRPDPLRISRDRTKAPYEKAEIAAYLAAAAAQPTTSRAMRATGLICLGAGAGLVGADLRHVRGTDVVARSGGLVVDVQGGRRRSVPVRRDLSAHLRGAAAHAGSGYVVGGNDPGRHNITTPLIASLSGGLGLERLDTGRLRATWLVSCARDLGIESFLRAAGVTCTQRLGDLVAGIEPSSEEEAVRLLSGGRAT